MNKFLEFFPFALLIIGTLGLLLNELVFNWGRTATLVFAAANVLGLTILAYAGLKRKRI